MYLSDLIIHFPLAAPAISQLAYGELELAGKSLQEGLRLKPDIEGAQADLDAVRVLILQQQR